MRTAAVHHIAETASVHDTATRLLQLLALLASRPRWSTAELADRLSVTPRTIRRDVDRLRRADYPVRSAPGPGGGYTLGRGGRLPPLVLDGDEAVAVAVGLRTAALGGVAGVGEAALTALAKLERTLPTRLRPRVAAIERTVSVLGDERTSVDADQLVVLAQACGRPERVRLTYRDRKGDRSFRDVEPLAVVHAARRWYLVAYDRDRTDWRTFRVDRIERALPQGTTFTHEDPPDPAALVSAALSTSPYRHRAEIRIHASIEEARGRFPPTVGVLTAEGPSCILITGCDDLGWLAWHLARLDLDYTVLEPPELVEELRSLARHVLAQVDRRGGPTGP